MLEENIQCWTFDKHSFRLRGVLDTAEVVHAVTSLVISGAMSSEDIEAPCLELADLPATADQQDCLSCWQNKSC